MIGAMFEGWVGKLVGIIYGDFLCKRIIPWRVGTCNLARASPRLHMTRSAL
jgi:hypothetical protein